VPDLQWNEPAAFPRNYPAPIPIVGLGSHIRFGVVVVVMLLLRAVLNVQNPWPWWSVFLIAIVTGLVFGYLLPMLFLFAPHTILVTAKGINRNGYGLSMGFLPAVELQFWDWQTFTSCSLESLVTPGGKFRSLILRDQSGGAVGTMALGAKVDEAALRAIFSEHGKALKIT
jgi:hypothetical protein